MSQATGVMMQVVVEAGGSDRDSKQHTEGRSVDSRSILDLSLSVDGSNGSTVAGCEKTVN